MRITLFAFAESPNLSRRYQTACCVAAYPDSTSWYSPMYQRLKALQRLRQSKARHEPRTFHIREPHPYTKKRRLGVELPGAGGRYPLLESIGRFTPRDHRDQITTGRAPYQGSNSPFAVLAKISRGISPALSDYVKKEIPGLAPLLDMCWRHSDVLRPDIGLSVATLASSQVKKEQSLASAVRNLPATITSVENSGQEACTINTNISRVAPEQLACLEGIFAMDSFPGAVKRNNISELIGLNPRQVQVNASCLDVCRAILGGQPTDPIVLSFFSFYCLA